MMWLRSPRWVSRMPTFARRAFQDDQMEFDSALSQMYSLCTHPSLVSKMSKARKMTKNYYHRDDPAFLVLQVVFIVVCTIAYGLAVGTPVIRLLFATTLFNVVLYAFWAVVFSAATRAFARYFLEGSLSMNEVRRSVDWRYALDVHCNGYFTFFMWSKVIPFALLPLLVPSPSTTFVRVLFNMLFMIGCGTYCYNVFLGYLELPSLTHQQTLMYPVPVLFVLILVLSLVSSTNLIAVFLPV